MRDHRSCNGCVQEGNCSFQRHDKVEFCEDVNSGNKGCSRCSGRGYVRGTGLQELHPKLGWTNMTIPCSECGGKRQGGE